ncbi:MAG: lamin tail domain-containing protein [Pirellulaceae bacterium]
MDAIDVWYDGAIGKDSATCNSYQQFGSLQTNSQMNNVTLTEDTVLAACGAAYRISGQLTVPAGVTLTIMPGTTLFFEEDAGLTVDGGRLVADGTPYETIRFTRSPSSVGSWQGIQFVESMQDNRLRHAIVEHGVTEEGMVGLRSSQLLIESTTFDHTDRFRIRTVDSSLVIRNSRFEDIFAADQPPTTDNRSEHIWGSGIADGGQLLIDGNYFGTTKGHNDAMDFDGAERPGPIPVIINNFFAGTGDDALDLETDAHIEGNVFRNVRKDEFNSSTGDANAISAGNGRHYVVVRNTFENVDHAVQVKDDAFLTFDHNTVVGVHLSAIYFDLPDRSPGKGAIITDSIFADTVATFSAADQAEIVEVHRSLVMPDAVAFGSDNFVADARFVAPQNHDFRLRPSSPAVNFGDSGLDLGAAVQPGAVIGSLRPERETTSHTAAFQIFGAGVEAYRYQLNDQPLSEIRSLDEPIELSNLANGMQRLRVIGRDSAGRWQALDDADEYQWNVNDQLPPIRINEILASNDSAFSASETYPDAIEIQNLSNVDFDLAGMSISDDAVNPRRYVFPPNTIVPAAGYLVLIADDRTDLPGVHLGFSLDADGEGVYLFAENGDTLDSVEFGLQVTDFSIGRVGDAADWQLTSPTLGSANQAARTGDAEQLHINEWLAANSVRFNDDYVELYNADNLPVELSGLYFSDDLTIDRYQHALPPLSFIPAHGFAVFQADENSGANHLSFRLNAEGEQLALIHRDGTLLDHVLYFAQQTDRSQGRSPDGSSHWQNEELPTPGQPNPVRTDQTIEHIGWDATWAYDSSGQSLPANWMTAKFDDQTWPQSTGVFAQRDAVLPLPVGTTIPTGVLSQRFRTSFQIGANTNLDAFTWTVSTLLDDGAVIYINGTEWLRIGMPDGEITETTRANRGVSSATVEGPLVIPAELLTAR